MQQVDHWTKDDFLSLLCICGAQADMNISKEEIEWIIKYFGEDTYTKTRALFDQNSEFENYEVLKYLKEKLYTDDSVDGEIRNNLKALFSADGSYSMMEKTFERALTRLLGS